MKTTMKANGKILPKTVNLIRNFNVAEPMINNKICPANILANNRTDKEMGLKKNFDNTSITTNKGASQLGIPEGKNFTLKKLSPKFLKAKSTQAIKKDRAKKKVTERCPVTVNLAYGVSPIKLANIINKNKIKINGKKVLALFDPDCSTINPKTNV